MIRKKQLTSSDTGQTNTINSAFSFNHSLFTLVLIFTILILSVPCSAQIENDLKVPKLLSEAPVLRFEKLGVQDGLTQGDVSSIFQDKKGFIWIGTQTGLHRYDGHEFKVFTSSPFDSTSIVSGAINSINESQNGDLWVATTGGLNRLNPATGKAVHYQYDQDNPTSISTNNAKKVVEGSNGDLWVSSYGSGLNRMRMGEEGVFTRYLHKPEEPASILSDVVLDIKEDQNGYIWAGTPNGLSRIDPKSNSIENYLHVSGRASFQGDSLVINALHIPDDGQEIMWLGTSYGLVRFNRKTKKYQRFLIQPEEKVENQRNSFHDIAPDPNDPNVLWLVRGRLGGIARFDMRTEQFTNYVHNPEDNNSLSSNSIYTLFLDRSGMMWAGTTLKGVNKFNPGAVNFKHLKNIPDNPSSLAPGFVWGIYEDSEGSLWVATVEDPFYLTQFDANSDKITRYSHDPNDPNTLLNRRFNVFAEDDQGGFWVGGSGGLNLLNRTTGKVKRFLRDTPEENTGRDNIWALEPMVRDSSKLYVGSAGGLHLLDTRNGVFSPIPLTDNTTDQAPRVYSLLQDTQGSLWVSTSIGLVEFTASGERKLKSVHNVKDTTSISSNRMQCILERRKEPGILWLASYQSGLDRLDVSTGLVSHLTMENGLPDNIIYGILEDDQGTLWMSTNNGISNYNPDTKQIRNYGFSEGLLALEYNQFSFAKGKDGRMYFGNVEGVTVFTPAQLITNERPPQVVISDVKLFNKSITSGVEVPYLNPSPNRERLTLEYDENELTIDFVALHFGNPEKNQYAYQLEGFDANWIDAGNKRSATYTNLPHGNFTFKVRAANADGVWNQEGASFLLTVLPPWYRTWWAYSIFGLLFITGIYAVGQIQRTRLLQKERKRTQEKELAQAREIEKAYNQLKSTQAQLIQSEKMASLGELTAGIAHEIQNPLNFVNNFSEVSNELIDEMNEELDKGDFEEAKAISLDIKQNLEKINHHGKRADNIVKGMLQHSRNSSGKKEPTDINALADEYLRLAYHGLRAKDKSFNATLLTDFDESLEKVEIIPQDIGRVILNLITNGFYAVNEKKKQQPENYEPTVTVRTKKLNNKLYISVKDNGMGIPEAIQKKIFQPFFTTKPTGQGTGLGLSMSYDIITKGHNGELKVETREGEGSEFLIVLPM
ncbi:two-component regulator propeller domain-containing protein [Arenibacter sp. GZD96]|uniref:two-component regulator propeller domain-containing protein n=1 Tax=Aurantibrevibacter litoralis TaxID=3106030 RepID=UPI002AFF3087|nr:two-component regulator propeller domain-containing protein [Arenibacter sp. GZD-96]MEA1786058.1 two-component regulator propeller domain-containing protein [Arenibacter sp. GZD-96]